MSSKTKLLLFGAIVFFGILYSNIMAAEPKSPDTIAIRSTIVKLFGDIDGDITITSSDKTTIHVSFLKKNQTKPSNSLLVLKDYKWYLSYPGLNSKIPQLLIVKNYGKNEPLEYAPTMAEAIECKNRLKQVTGAQQQWALEFKQKGEDLVTLSDVTIYLRNPDVTTCPRNGKSYELKQVSSPPTCPNYDPNDPILSFHKYP